MATIMPQGELLRRAVRWIDERRSNTDESLATLIDTAAMNFNLSPKDAHFLNNFFKERDGESQD